MLLVGLTGGLASGKSFIGRTLETCGCHLIRADDLGHEVLEPDGPAYPGVLAEFGSYILKEDGTINRRLLGSIVFAAPERLELLNRLVHPHVFAIEDKRIAALRAGDSRAMIVIEAAIMIETGSYKRYDAIVLAVCSPETQIARAMHRDQLPRHEVEARLARQMPLDGKRAFADYVIDTDHSKEETIARVHAVYGALRALEEARFSRTESSPE
ncbi:MAG: dephospho-CoA kinase [Bryobacterales bacterium]|nr:dephospho-CoA kinase [Bryobacterales bacterium]